MPGPEPVDHHEVRSGLGGQEPERDVVLATALQRPRARDPMGVAIDQNLQHQPRVIRRATTHIGVVGVDPRQIQTVLDQVINPPRRMTRTQQVPKIRSQQHRLILVITPERLIHRRFRLNRVRRQRLHVDQHRLLRDLRLRHTWFSRSRNGGSKRSTQQERFNLFNRFAEG